MKVLTRIRRSREPGSHLSEGCRQPFANPWILTPLLLWPQFHVGRVPVQRFRWDEAHEHSTLAALPRRRLGGGIAWALRYTGTAPGRDGRLSCSPA